MTQNATITGTTCCGCHSAGCCMHDLAPEPAGRRCCTNLPLFKGAEAAASGLVHVLHCRHAARHRSLR